MTWLTQVRQQGFDVTIEGRCLSLTSLSDFIGNLEASRYFKRPVEESCRVKWCPAERRARHDSIREIKGSFQMAGIEQIAVEPAPTRGRATKAPAKGGPRG